MDATLAGLLHACVSVPEDATPHLILADWLEDHGQPERAELVRVQSRLAGWVPDWQERSALIQRQDDLIAAHRARWLGPLLGSCERVEFARGLCRLQVTSQVFSTNAFGRALVDHVSMVLPGRVRLTRCRSLARVATRPWLALVPALSLAGLALQPQEFIPFFQSPYLEHLADLDLAGTSVCGSEIALESPVVKQLVRCGLRNSTLTDARVLGLLDSGSSRLRDLDVAGVPLGPATLAVVAARASPGRRMNSLGMEFVRVPAGTFQMGSDPSERGSLADQYPKHLVELSRPFWLGRFAVTQAQYREITGVNPARFGTSSANLPVENVNYEEASEFCRRLGQLALEQAAGHGYRLPTEAEWEHACRAGTLTQYSWGDEASLDRMNYVGRFHSNEDDCSHPGRPLAVGSFDPNPFGLYEMHGNIWEWTSDWFSERWHAESPVLDPTGPGEGVTRTIRGGCWHAVGICCRSAHRFGEDPDTQDDYTGFRVVLVPQTEEAPRLVANSRE